MNVTRRVFIASTGGAVLGAAALSTLSCGGPALNTLLDEITIAAELALPFVPGLPPGVGTLIASYVEQAVNAVELSAAELSSTDTATQKALAVAGFFAQAVVPNLKALGVPADVAAKVQAIEGAIEKVLTAITGAHNTLLATKQAGTLKPALSHSAATDVILHAHSIAVKAREAKAAAK